MKHKTTIVMLSVIGALSTLAGCATTTRTSIRHYEYSDQIPDKPNTINKGEYEMVSPGKMTSPGSMVSPTDHPH